MKRILYFLILNAISVCMFSQNVGIGNNSPQSKLHVSGAIRSDTLIYTGPTVRNLFAAPNGRIYDSLVAPAAADWLINGNGNIGATNFLGTTNANDLIFKTNNVEAARFTAASRFGIGTSAPNVSALVEMVSTTGGLLIPRMTTAQRTAIATPANGLLVYDITINCLFYYNSALTSWQSLCTPPLPPGTNDVSGTYPALTVTGLQTTPVAATTPTAGQILQFNGTSWTPTNGTFWNLLGNAGTVPTTNFVGTTDNVDLVFRTNNTEKARILANGNVGINTSIPRGKFDVLNGDAYVADNVFPAGNFAVGRSATLIFADNLKPYTDNSLRIYDNNSNSHITFDANSNGVIQFYTPAGSAPAALENAATTGVLAINPYGGFVGVGTTAPQAYLDVVSTVNGFAMPRMTSAQRKAIVSPVPGVQVYDTNLMGYYYWDGTKWDCANNPAGTVQYFANTTPPNGYLECNGAAVNRTTYAELFAAIGITYGPGNGSTTFNLPDLRGEFIRGYDNGKGADPSRVIGTWQSPSPLVHDDTPGVAAQDTDFSMDNAATSLSDAWPTATVGSIPNAYWGRGNSVSPVANWVVYSGAPAQGMISASRPRNVALMPCIKY